MGLEPVTDCLEGRGPRLRRPLPVDRLERRFQRPFPIFHAAVRRMSRAREGRISRPTFSSSGLYRMSEKKAREAGWLPTVLYWLLSGPSR